MKIKIAVLTLMWAFLALPMLGETYKLEYPNPCSDLWGAVKSTLSVPENYTVVTSDDGKMTAKYKVHHDVHVTITGAILQRDNKVTLVAKGTGCEMQVVSNYSGFEHNDKDDFKKRVDDFLANPKDTKPTEPPKPNTVGK
ncbi:MAG TPA: hypothetical protein VLV89_06100 [Candidatus Acidoferrum sp.]|nr:hypothetical protein [Candidatus Acidoferrum sp.]